MVEKIFKLQQKNTNLRTEITAGATTFLTMAYIIFVNADILSAAGMDKSALIAVTCLVSGIATLAVGLLSNTPIAMAPGMGLNAFFAFTLVKTENISWQVALGVVFLSGLFFLVITACGLRKKLVQAIPPSLIAGISIGIGLFITFIGLQNMGLVVNSPATLVQAASFKSNPTILIGLAGLILIIFLELKRIKGSLLFGIAFATILALVFKQIQGPAEIFKLNTDISPIALKLDIIGALKYSLLAPVFTLMFIDMFDSVGTLIACSRPAGLIQHDGSIKKLDRLLFIDAAATMFGALAGTSTTTAYIESASGIEQGGRTGLASVVTGILFLLSMLFVPLVAIVPSYATAGALIMVGLFMMKEIKNINFDDLNDALPAFIIMIMIALSYSISTGLALGFISFIIVKVIGGRLREIKPAMWIIAVLSVIYFCV